MDVKSGAKRRFIELKKTAAGGLGQFLQIPRKKAAKFDWSAAAFDVALAVAWTAGPTILPIVFPDLYLFSIFQN